MNANKVSGAPIYEIKNVDVVAGGAAITTS